MIKNSEASLDKAVGRSLNFTQPHQSNERVVLSELSRERACHVNLMSL